MHHFDEAFTDRGDVREPYRDLLDRIAPEELSRMEQQVGERIADRGVRFGGDDGHQLHVDPVPRVLTTQEWELLSAGVAQRVRALEAFVDDTYGDQRLVADGVVPASVVGGSPYFEKDLVGARPPGGTWISVAGLDVVRGGDGEFRVLEDNVRTPSGLAYAMAASDAVSEVMGLHPPDQLERVRTGRALRRALEASAPDVEGELVLLTEGETNTAWYEQRRLAELAGLVLATPHELRRTPSRLYLADRRLVRAVYRRTDDDRIRARGGALTEIAQLLLDPWREGNLGLVNCFGTGVADDKSVYAHVDGLVRDLLGEEPLLRSVTTYDLTDAGQLEEVLDVMDRLVVKPRDGLGGQGVVVGPAATPAELDDARRSVREDPAGWVAQEAVMLSTVPTVVDGQLEPRHCDLRPFAIADGTSIHVPRGGLTRVALTDGSMVVNSSREGGAKATWVV